MPEALALCGLAMVGEDLDVLDFEAGRALLRSGSAVVLREAEADGWADPDATPEEVFADLLGALREVEEAIRGENTFVASLPFGAWTIFVTGGATWGEEPSGPYAAFSRVGSSPTLTDAIGFCWPGTAVSCAREATPPASVLDALATEDPVVNRFIANLRSVKSPEVRITVEEVRHRDAAPEAQNPAT